MVLYYDGGESMARNKSEKFFLGMKIFPIIIFSLVVLIAFFYRDKMTLDTLLNFTPKNLILAMVYIFICYGVKSISIVFPIAALFLLSGKIFNPLIAILVNMIGIAISVSIPYCIGRYLGEEMTSFLKAKYPAIKKLDEFSTNNQYFFSYITRAINILPGDIVSLFLGSSALEYRKYLIGSILGMIPTMISITIMGENISNPKSPEFLISMGVTVFFSLISIPLSKCIRKKKN